jgi:paraquat-inducible protein B
LHITLFTNEAGSIGPGAPILYKGLSAAKSSRALFHPENGKVEFGAFVSEQFVPLVRKNTKFWNISGIDVQLGVNGCSCTSAPWNRRLNGGITFGQLDAAISAPPVSDGASFILYDSLSDTKKFVMRNSLPYLLLFTGSVRGLNQDAPVEFRGVRIGTVNGVSFNYLPDDPDRRVPVLVQIDPTLITNLPTESTEPAEKFVEEAVRNGLRASLKIGNYLTAQMYVDLDFKRMPGGERHEVAGYQVIPTGGSAWPS